MAHYTGGGSAPAYLSGLITAFCFRNKDGECLYRPDDLMMRLDTSSEVKTYTPNVYGPAVLELDGVKYHYVSGLEVEYASVPVKFQDIATGTTHEMLFVAGSVGMQLSSSEECFGRDKGNQIISKKDRVFNTVQPVSGWWIFEKMELKRRIEYPRII